MNTKSTLSALCLCLTAGGADAAIINYTSYISMQATAGHASNGPYEDPTIYLADVTTYTNTISASANDSFTTYDGNCQCDVTYYASAGASSSLALNADLGGGLFSASGAFSSYATGWFGASGYSAADIRFEVTTPYAYTVDINASAGSAASVQLWGNFQDSNDWIYTFYENGGINLHQSGILLPGGQNGIYVSIIGGTGSIGGPDGDFQFTLTLTPTTVPVPAAAWLFGSGLAGLIGMARRKAV